MRITEKMVHEAFEKLQCTWTSYGSSYQYDKYELIRDPKTKEWYVGRKMVSNLRVELHGMNHLTKSNATAYNILTACEVAARIMGGHIAHGGKFDPKP